MTSPGDGALRVLCVDDNELVARSIALRLDREPDITCLGAIHDGAEICRRVQQHRPDVVLMDVDMPGVDTFAIVDQLAAESPEIKVIMLSGHVNHDFISRALDSGAWGYLSKDEDVAMLIDSLRRVAGGEVVFSREVQSVMRASEAD